MNILGLIVEYNPFHNGHLYHLNTSKNLTNATHTVAIMSGNFLQRGEPALFDKYSRAKCAVENGVDLVIELPTLFACQSAELFSLGAINTLNSLNCVNSICFGSEEGDINILYTISRVLAEEPFDFKLFLKNYLNEGLLYPVARSNALFDYLTKYNLLNISKDKLYNILNSSNNILGLEYIKSIIKLNSNIKPHTITRILADYNSQTIESSICSATAIRSTLKSSNNNLDFIKDVVPSPTFNMIQNNISNNFNPVFDTDFLDLIRFSILKDCDVLDTFFEINEGIENKIYQNVFIHNNLQELQLSIKSKRYTLTKIKRMLNNILLGITKEDISIVKNATSVPYVRILAFNDKGREIIKEIKNNSDITIINKFANLSYDGNDTIFKTLIEYDLKASNLYNLIYYKNNNNLLKGPMDYFISPTYVR